MGFVSDYQATLTTARELALRATRLDDQNEYAHWALGISYFGLAGHEESIAALERALELNPNCSVAYGSLGTALAWLAASKSRLPIRKSQSVPIRAIPASSSALPGLAWPTL